MGCGMSSRRPSRHVIDQLQSESQPADRNQTVATSIAKKLGSELYKACADDDVAQVKSLTSNTAGVDWSMVLIASAFESATEVATYCIAKDNEIGIISDMLWWVSGTDDFDPAYRFLVESNFVSINHSIERTGTLLGMIAGEEGLPKKHALAEYMLRKGADPNQKVEWECHRKLLTCAAGYSDTRMVELLLDYKAEVRGSGAIVLAAQNGRLDNVKLLIARGADLNEMGVATLDKRSLKELGTPLHKAVENSHVEVIDVLLRHGADVALKDAQGRTAAAIAMEKGLDATVLARLTAAR